MSSSSTGSTVSVIDEQPLDRFYILPSHPSIISSDPLSTCDSGEAFPTAWAVFLASVAAFRDHTFSLVHLPDLIEDLAYSLHDNGKADAGFLRRYIKDHYPEPEPPSARALLTEILQSALALPQEFPTQTIPYLSIDNPFLNLTRSQVRSLVAHQFLGTLKPPTGNTWGCTLLCWYSNHQPVKHAIRGYISSVFHYFRPTYRIQTPIRYELRWNPTTSVADWLNTETTFFDWIQTEAIDPATQPFPHPEHRCVLVSSNAEPGFGPSCTQEELITGACPELLPFGALFVSPPLPHEAALLSQGPIPMTAWQGHGRDGRRVHFLERYDEYTFLLLDASELDVQSRVDGVLLDLEPRFFLRDLHKAYTGLLALRSKGMQSVLAPLWGTSAFGGDPVVKFLILALAGGLAGVVVTLSVDQSRLYPEDPTTNLTPEARNVLRIFNSLKASCSTMTIQQAWSHLSSERLRACRTGVEVAVAMMSNS